MKKLILIALYCFASLSGITKLSADDLPNTFDIMYVYTTGAKERAGGKTQIEQKIHDSINYINQSFFNSNMNISVNLVYVGEVNYPPDYNGIDDGTAFVQALYRLKGKTDGYMDEIHTLRNIYSADFVQLVVANQSYGGYAFTMSNEANPYFESSAFSVVKQHNMHFSAVHELGHNMGVNHGTGPGTYSYSNGYSDGTIRTIHGDHPGNLINYWSSPLIYYNNRVTGTATKDARKTILENAPILANFRQRPITTAPSLTITPPPETYANTLTLEINGTPSYEVFVNGITYGTLDVDGKATINLEDLAQGINSFNIQLKDPISGTLSQILTFTTQKKDAGSILIPIYYLLLD